jgi:chromosomal replication initiation ATPase DnaA
VAVRNSFVKEYIESRFGDVLEEAVVSRLGEGARLEVIVGERVRDSA